MEPFELEGGGPSRRIGPSDDSSATQTKKGTAGLALTECRMEIVSSYVRVGGTKMVSPLCTAAPRK
eukprot:1771359-Amphidinium_carterae.2